MADTTDIEKKSLEAHVELCAERYRFLESKLETVDSKITMLEDMMRSLHGMISEMRDQRHTQIQTWGTGIIAVLVGIIGYLLAHFVLQ